MAGLCSTHGLRVNFDSTLTQMSIFFSFRICSVTWKEPAYRLQLHSTEVKCDESWVTYDSAPIPMSWVGDVSGKQSWNFSWVRVESISQIKSYDFSDLMSLASKLSMLSANKANGSASIVSLTFASQYQCFVTLIQVKVISGHQVKKAKPK